ncbi:MAG: MazG-like family protein [Caldilineaceae bacterium]|nr:MazG-like family protein [Caldilineaceae bacterium]
MKIQEIQDNARALCEQQGWTDRNPSQRFRYLISEVGELSQELTRLEWNPGETDLSEIKRNIGHEMYDIVWNLCELANQLEIDLEAAFAEKQAINAGRRWE